MTSIADRIILVLFRVICILKITSCSDCDNYYEQAHKRRTWYNISGALYNVKQLLFYPFRNCRHRIFPENEATVNRRMMHFSLCNFIFSTNNYQSLSVNLLQSSDFLCCLVWTKFFSIKISIKSSHFRLSFWENRV